MQAMRGSALRAPAGRRSRAAWQGRSAPCTPTKRAALPPRWITPRQSLPAPTPPAKGYAPLVSALKEPCSPRPQRGQGGRPLSTLSPALRGIPMSHGSEKRVRTAAPDDPALAGGTSHDRRGGRSRGPHPAAMPVRCCLVRPRRARCGDRRSSGGSWRGCSANLAMSAATSTRSPAT